jgi:integrase
MLDGPRKRTHTQKTDTNTPSVKKYPLPGPRTLFAELDAHNNASRLSKEFVDLLASVGIRKTLPHTRTGKRVGSRRAPSELSFHCLRQTAVSLLKDAGVPQAVVQELIGHDSAQMSQQYTHVGIEALQKATAALPDLGGIGRGSSL